MSTASRRHSFPLPRNEPTLIRSDYVIFLGSSDLQQEGHSPGPSACVWQTRTMDGTIVDEPDPKQSRTGVSDEKRGLAAAFVGSLETVGAKSFCLVYAPGTYICDGVMHARDWKARGWRNSQNEPIANPDIWERYLELVDDNDLDVCARRWDKEYCSHVRSHLNSEARKACRART